MLDEIATSRHRWQTAAGANLRRYLAGGGYVGESDASVAWKMRMRMSSGSAAMVAIDERIESKKRIKPPTARDSLFTVHS